MTRRTKIGFLIIISLTTIFTSCHPTKTVTEQIKEIEATSTINQSYYEKNNYIISNVLYSPNSQLSEIGEDVKNSFTNQIIDFKYTKNNDSLFIHCDSLIFFLKRIEQTEEGIILHNDNQYLKTYKGYKLVPIVAFSAKNVEGYDMNGTPCHFKTLNIEEGALCFRISKKGKLYDTITFNINIRETRPR